MATGDALPFSAARCGGDGAGTPARGHGGRANEVREWPSCSRSPTQPLAKGPNSPAILTRVDEMRMNLQEFQDSRFFFKMGVSCWGLVSNEPATQRKEDSNSIQL